MTEVFLLTFHDTVASIFILSVRRTVPSVSSRFQRPWTKNLRQREGTRPNWEVFIIGLYKPSSST